MRRTLPTPVLLEPVAPGEQISRQLVQRAEEAIYRAARAGTLTAGAYCMQGTERGCALYHIDRALGSPWRLPDRLRGEIARASDGTLGATRSPWLAYLEVAKVLGRWAERERSAPPRGPGRRKSGTRRDRPAPSSVASLG